MKPARSFVLVLLLVLALGHPSSQAADPVSEMASFSVFGKVDLNELAKGEIKTATGAPMSNPRHLSAQSCFVIPKPPAQVIAAMKRFDPTAHRELKVYLHSDLPAAPSAPNFSKLNDPPGNGAVKSLEAATQKMSPQLQLSQDEAKSFSAGEPVFGFWVRVLAKRAQAFTEGGASAEAAYDHSPNPAQPGKEFSSLVRQQGKLQRQFGRFLDSTGLVGGKGSIRPDLYWELLEVEDEGVLTLGASYQRSASGEGTMIADGLYYASGGFNVALTLYQLWPVEIGGRASTLVWRGDLVSANSLGELHGIERLASESAMRKDILRAATLFQREGSR